MSAWLVNAGCSGMVGVLIDGALELLEELINVEQIALGPQVRQW